MQIKALVKKDLLITLSHKLVWVSLIGPGLFITVLGLAPFVFQDSSTVLIFAISQDETFRDINLGLKILYGIKEEFENVSYIEFYVLTDLQQALQKENLLWIPANFTRSLVEVKHAVYYIKCCVAGSLGCQIMTEIIPRIIDDTLKERLNNSLYPKTQGVILPGSNLNLKQETLIEQAVRLSFIISYAIFLLTLMLGSVGRLAGFTRDKNDGMLELIYSLTSNKKELIISKLFTAFVLSAISVFSYGVGILIVLTIHGMHGASKKTRFDQETESLFDVSPKIFEPLNLLLITLALLTAGLIIVLISLIIQITVSADVSERFEGLVLLGLSFLFFIGILTNPLEPRVFLILNPLYWPYRLLMGYFYPSLFSEGTYLFAILIFSSIFGGIILASKMVTREDFVIK